MQELELKNLVIEALDDLKAVDVLCLEVAGQTEVCDFMVIASGTSNRHVKALAGNVVQEANQKGIKPHGLEGLEDGEWVLIDLVDVVVHVMLPKAREFYDLERLWSVDPRARPEESGQVEH